MSGRRLPALAAAPGGSWDVLAPLGPTIAEMVKAGTLAEHRPHGETAGASARDIRLHVIDEASLVLTAPIPCTTPPVRDGWYDVEYCGPDEVLRCGFWRLEWRNGVWSDKHGVAVLSPALVPAHYQWRGVRRWVLTVPSLCGDRDDYIVNIRPRGVVLEAVAELYNPHFRVSAMAFDTEADAVAYATKHAALKDGAQRLAGWKAVLA